MFPNIEAERVRLRMSRAYLAELLGVSLRTYSNWMNGVRDIPSSALIKMAKLFCCSTDYLLDVQTKSA